MIQNKERTAAEARSLEVAEASREETWRSRSFLASLFMGSLELDLVHPFPEQSPEDRAEGDAICERVDAWCREHLDGDRIDREEQIPAHVWRGLKELGLFGIKIPREHGGLGLSQTNYLRVLSVVARYCVSTASTLSAHQSIGVPQPLKLFGTEEQKRRWLPRIAGGAVTAFALTEPGVGSDPANMATTATPTEDGWVLNGEKLWCTNGPVADVIVVMARTPDRVVDGRQRRSISAFLVETDREGVELLHRCRFMGIRGIENGLLRFRDVRIPRENLIGEEGQGLRIALTTLNDGRLGIPFIIAESMAHVAAFSASWAKTREQWGRPIGEHEAGAEKLARLHAGAYAMRAFAAFAAALSDRGDVDIRMEAAAAKMYNTELGWELVDTALQLRGGRGFETADSLRARGEVPFPMERALRDTRINRIVEGTTDIMHLFLAREALDAHLQVAGDLFRPGPPLARLAALGRAAAFYARWLPGLFLGGLGKRFSRFDRAVARELRAVERRVRRLARVLFWQMLRHGPRLERRQLVLFRLVDIGVELGVMAVVASRVQGELDRGDRSHLDEALYWLRSRRERVDALFRELRRNSDAAARRVAQRALAAADPLPDPEPVDLRPLPRDVGSDLTSGRQPVRGGSVDKAAS